MQCNNKIYLWNIVIYYNYKKVQPKMDSKKSCGFNQGGGQELAVMEGWWQNIQ